MVCEESSSSSETAPSSELIRIASAADSSAESSFRELDDAFLQTQVRIWLGEVLQIRLDEQPIISELLADGELLFQVSKVVWKMLLAKHVELRHIKAYQSQPFASERNSGRYRPYSNVDSFLKICKIMGLTGVDLFSPSDVVEKRNTRRVCMCIRSFSKKSRTININVPDFDSVTCMVAMPKDLVGCIRRSIEDSHSTITDSFRHSLQNHARRISRQGYTVTGSTRDYKTHSDHSDDSEIVCPVFQFDALHTDDMYDCTSEIIYNMPSPTVESVFMPEDLDQLDIQDQQRSEISNEQFESLCYSLQCDWSANKKHEHDSELAWSSSSSCRDTRVEQVSESMIMDMDYSEHVLLRNNDSDIEALRNDKTPVKYAKNKIDTDLFDEENSALNVHQTASSHGSNSTPGTIENRRCSDTCDNMKVLQALNLGDQFDAENNFKNTESFKLHNDKNDHWEMIKEYEAQDIMKCREMAYCMTYNSRNSPFIEKFEETDHSLDSNFCDTKWDQKGKCAVTPNRASDNRSLSCFLEDGSHEETAPCKQKACEVLISKVMLLSCEPNEDAVKFECSDGNQACQHDEDHDSHSEHTCVAKEEIKSECESIHYLENIVETEEGAIEKIPKGKPKKKLLLRSVLGGAAAVGLVFTYLNLRRNGGEKSALPPPSKASGHKDKENIQENSSQKVKKMSTTTKGVYPAEQLQLK